MPVKDDPINTAFTTWRGAPTPANGGLLLKQLDPVIKTALTSYGGGAAGSPTLRGRAKRLALDAAKTYDPNRGSLQTHVMSHLRRLHRVGGREQQIISVPERLMLASQQLGAAETELTDRHGRLPSTRELADHTGLSLKRIAQIRSMKAPVAEGSYLQRYATDENFEMPASVVPGQAGQEWEELVYQDLDPIDQTIMEHGLGLHGVQRLGGSEIAKKLGISPSAVSQRTARIQQLLDERYNVWN